MTRGCSRLRKRAAAGERRRGRTRALLRFSLRNLLLLVAAIAVWLGWLVEGARRQREAVAIVRGSGGYVGYDYNGRFEPRISRRRWRPEGQGHHFLRTVFGDDVISSVDMVALGATTDPDVLLRLPAIEVLHLYCTPEANRNPSTTPEPYLKAAVDVVAVLKELKCIRLSSRFTFADAVKMQRAHPNCAINLPGGCGPMTSLHQRFELGLATYKTNPCVEADGDDYIVYGRKSDRGVRIGCLGNPLIPPLNAKVTLEVVRCAGAIPHRKRCGLPLARIEARFRYEDDTWTTESDGWKQTWAAVKVLHERPNVDIASIATDLARQFRIVSLDQVVRPSDHAIPPGPDAEEK